ncbi:MAG TPA: murein biosynthesis integral membrane protein MurJ [Anaerolineaceae bacterium]
MKKISFLARTSLLLSVFFAADKGMAILRQLIIARQFGLSLELDAFNAANNLPDLLYAVISGGALAIAFLPVLSQVMNRDGRPASWVLFSRITNLALIVTAGFAIVIALLADPLVSWQIGIAPGFTADQQHLVANLMRLNLIATLIFSISGLVMAGLQANQHFLLPALSPLLYNLGQIFGALVLSPTHGYHLGPVTLPAFGLGVYGLVDGVILGALLHLAIQIPGLIRFKFHWSPQIGFNDPTVRQVLRLLGPRVLTIFFIQLGFILRDNLASRLGQGAVSSLTYGWMLMQVPETLIGTAIGTAMLPTLAEQAARGDWVSFRDTIDRAMRVLIAVTIPVALLVSLGLRPLVAFAFHFDAQSTDMLVWVTRAYLFGVIAHSLLEVASRGFYAQQEARIPLFASGLCTLAYGLLTLLLAGPLGVPGIALANTLAFSGEALLLIVLLGRRLPGKFHWGSTLLRTALGAAAAGLLMAVVMNVLPIPPVFLAVFAAALGGLAALPFIWREMRLLVRL